MTQRLSRINGQGQFDQFLLLAIVVCVPLVLITPLIVSSSTLFPFVVGKAIFSRSVIEAIFALWLILIVYYPKHRPSRSLVLISLSIGLLVSILASFTGVSFNRSLWSTYERMNGVIDQAHWLAFVLVVGSVYSSLSSWRFLLSFNLGVAGIVSAIGLGHYYNLFDFNILDYSSGSANYLASTLGNSAFMGAYVMGNSIIGLGLIFHSLHYQETPSQSSQNTNQAKSQPKLEAKYLRLLPVQIFWLLSTYLCAWSLWLTASRGALFGLSIGAVILLIGYIYWRTERLIIRNICIALVIFIVTATLIIMASLLIVARSSTNIDGQENSSSTAWRILEPEGDTSYGRRLAALKTTPSAYAERPILGWGPENYLIPWGKYLNTLPDDDLLPFDNAHNKLVEELVTKGTIGFLSYIFIWLTIAIVLVFSIKHRSGHSRFFVTIIGAVLVGLFVQILFLSDTLPITLHLSLLMAFLVSEESKNSTKGKSNLRSKDRPFYIRHIKTGFVTLVAILTIWSIYSINLRPYLAAQAASETLRSNLWPDIETNFRKSINTFPPLANTTRELAIDFVSYVLDDNMSHEDYMRAINLMSEEGKEALQLEPQNWDIHLSLAQFYWRAALQNPEYLNQAQWHGQEAFRLAPEVSRREGWASLQE